MSALWALVRNDLRLYRHDRRAVIVGVLVPVLISMFFGYVFGGNRQGDSGKVQLAVVDEDQAPLSGAIVASLKADAALEVLPVTRSDAEDRVRHGKLHVAVVIPAGFSARATQALFTGRDRPAIAFLLDPSERMSGEVAQGLFAEHAMQEISRAAFTDKQPSELLGRAIQSLEARGADAAAERADLKALSDALERVNRRAAESGGATTGGPGRGLTVPYDVEARPLTDASHVPYNGYAHSFAGMSVQFILFAGIDAGVLLLLLRERGIWQRYRSAPLSRAQLLAARVVSTSLVSLFQFAVIYAVAMLVCHVRIAGSLAGFVAIIAAFSVLNGAFGLMLAAIGRSPGVTRGFASLATLLLVMIGGAWVPAFVFPRWLQQASLFSPTRWAVDGLDAMTWRALGPEAAVAPVLVLLGTATVCLVVALWRFRWDE